MLGERSARPVSGARAIPVPIIAPSAGRKIKADQHIQAREAAHYQGATLRGGHAPALHPRDAQRLLVALRRRLTTILLLLVVLLPALAAAEGPTGAQGIASQGNASQGHTAPAHAPQENSAQREAAGQLDFIAALYVQGDSFRAESEMLRFLGQFPEHPSRPAVGVARAKLYYRRGYPAQSSLMLFSLRDRYAPGALPPETLRLLVFSLVREGRLDEAAALGEAAGLPPGAVQTLGSAPPGSVDGGSAVAWSTVLPGSGFYALGQPGRGTAALGLNLVFIGGTVAAWQQDNVGAALVLLLVELALYRGGREAVREEAAQINGQRQTEQRDAWLAMHGEAALLARAFSGAD